MSATYWILFGSVAAACLIVWVKYRYFASHDKPRIAKWKGDSLAAAPERQMVPAYHVGESGCGKPAFLMEQSFVEAARAGENPRMQSMLAAHLDGIPMEPCSALLCDSCGKLIVPFGAAMPHPKYHLSFDKPVSEESRHESSSIPQE